MGGGPIYSSHSKDHISQYESMLPIDIHALYISILTHLLQSVDCMSSTYFTLNYYDGMQGCVLHSDLTFHILIILAYNDSH